MTETKEWFLAVLDTIFEISSKEFQKHVWLQGESPFVSCWEECMYSYEDYNCNDLIDSPELWAEVGLSEEDRAKMNAFRKDFDVYDKSTDNCGPVRDKAMIEDPRWIDIREKAKALRLHFWPIYKRFCEELANDKNEEKRESVLFRLWTPSKIVKKLLKDPSAKIAKRAYEALPRQQILEEWHKDTDFMNEQD